MLTDDGRVHSLGVKYADLYAETVVADTNYQKNNSFVHMCVCVWLVSMALADQCNPHYIAQLRCTVAEETHITLHHYGTVLSTRCAACKVLHFSHRAKQRRTTPYVTNFFSVD